MKKLWFIFFFILSGCSHTECNESKQARAERLVKLFFNLYPQPENYHSISFSKIEPLRSSELTSEWCRIKILQLSVDSELNVEHNTFKHTKLQEKISITSVLNKLKADSTKWKTKADSIEKKYKNRLVGWAITNTYIAKNDLGDSVLYKMRFKMDPTISKVLVGEQISKQIIKL